MHRRLVGEQLDQLEVDRETLLVASETAEDVPQVAQHLRVSRAARERVLEHLRQELVSQPIRPAAEAGAGGEGAQRDLRTGDQRVASSGGKALASLLISDREPPPVPSPGPRSSLGGPTAATSRPAARTPPGSGFARNPGADVGSSGTGTRRAEDPIPEGIPWSSTSAIFATSPSRRSTSIRDGRCAGPDGSSARPARRPCPPGPVPRLDPGAPRQRPRRDVPRRAHAK